MAGHVAWWAAAIAAAGTGVFLFGRDAADSFGTTWIAVAAGAETFRTGSAATVWDGARGVLVPHSPVPFLVASTTGLAGAAGAWMALLALGWMVGTRHLALVLGARPAVAGAAAILAGALVLSASDGRSTLLEAAAFPGLLAAIVGRSGAFATAGPVLGLGLLSPEGIRLALPVLAAEALFRSGAGAARWLPTGLAVATLFAVPEPEWARVVRFEAPRLFLEGAWAWPERTLPEALRFAVAGARSVGMKAGLAAAGLVLGALVGAIAAGRRGTWVALLALGLAAVAAGGSASPAPAPVLGLVFPALHVLALPDVAAIALGPVLLAVAARTPAAAGIAAACLVPVLVTGRPVAAATADAPGPIVEAVASGGGDVLALPLTIANDRRWRRALPGSMRLQNGTRGLLAANAPLLARELAEADPPRAREILGRLGIERVVVPITRAAEFGTVELQAGGEALVRLPAGDRLPARRSCLDPDGWALRASVGHPEVSVPTRAVDGDPATRWGTGAPQAAGQFFEIDFGRELSLDHLELGYERFASDFPRGFRVLADGAASADRVVFVRDPYFGEPTWRDGFLYERTTGTVRIPVGDRVRRLRIELTRPSDLHDWSIAWICAVEAAPGAGGGVP